MKLSENIKRLRKQNNLTLRKLAEKSNLAYGAIGNLERGVITDPHISTVIKLAKAFDVSIADRKNNFLIVFPTI